MSAFDMTATALDEAFTLLKMETREAIIHNLVRTLAQVRTSCAPELWSEIVSRYRSHPFCQLAAEAPFVRHGLNRPRGYPGDAILIDYIYGESHPSIPALDGEGPVACIQNALLRTPTTQAVRTRRKILHDGLESLVARGSRGSALAVACGHFRELHGIDSKRFQRIVGLDQDEETLATTRACFHDITNLELICASVLSLLVLDNDIGHFDFINAAGLFDYLPKDTARTLASRLYEMLNPGGLLLIPNFLASSVGPAAMELVMDWWLIYRTKAEIIDLAQAIPAIETRNCRFDSEDDEIGYLRIWKPE